MTYVTVILNLIIKMQHMDIFLPFDASVSGHWIDGLFYLAFWLTLVTFIIVIGILSFFLIRYRAVKGRKSVYDDGENSKARLFTVLFAIFIFIVIDLNLAFHDHVAWEHAIGGPVKGTPLKIQVFAQQFAWNIRYAGPDGRFNTPDDVVSINQMHVPVGQPVLLQMRSKDVIHSFFLPNFRIKQDVVPGMVTMMKFHPAKQGEYDIACAEHCGLGHYRMRGLLKVESKENFDQWIVSKIKQPTASENWGWEWIGK